MAEYRVLLVSPYPELVEVVGRVSREFPDLDVVVHQGDLSQGLEVALGNMESDFDVIVSRGGTAQMLEDELSLPVVEIDVSAADLLEALAIHNPRGRRCAVVGFSNALDAVREVADFSDFDLDIYDVSFEDELPLVLEDVSAGDYEIVLCDTFSQDACTRRGMDAHLLMSGEKSVAKALRQALDFCERTDALRSQNHVLWQIIRSLPTKTALFEGSGKLVYANLGEHRQSLLALMRNHLGGPMSERLVLHRGRRTYRVSKTSFELEGGPLRCLQRPGAEHALRGEPHGDRP